MTKRGGETPPPLTLIFGDKMSAISNIKYKNCAGCGLPMIGIFSGNERTAHNECGGKPHFDALETLKYRIYERQLKTKSKSNNYS